MAMTPAERTAVRFLVAVAVLGSGVRVAAQWRHREVADPVAQEALRRQRAAVDSARLAARAARPARRAQGRGARDGARDAASGAAGALGGSAGRGVRVQRVGSAAPLPPVGASVAYGPASPPPVMTMWPAEAGGPAGAGDVRASRRRRSGTAGETGPGGAASRLAEPVNVDRATAAELEALPRVGPVLAARIVADRAARGAFGSLEGLSRVAGVGPGLIRFLAPHVTFSTGGRRVGGQ
jgi:hypothetical protein